ncbi:MAG: cupin domain-containing protein [Gammaproteobacteria bacterium]|jgi:ethanolamine utilization protein EutQ
MISLKAPPRAVRYDDLEFAPRFEYGHMARVAETCGADDGSELGAGWVRLEDARIPWTVRYDELLTVFEGALRVHASGEIYQLDAHDSVWLPAGTEVIYEAEAALVHYAIHPSNRQQGS